jgi:hypothetical protein
LEDRALSADAASAGLTFASAFLADTRVDDTDFRAKRQGNCWFFFGRIAFFTL